VTAPDNDLDEKPLHLDRKRAEPIHIATFEAVV
jgi:hypothetical protein